MLASATISIMEVPVATSRERMAAHRERRYKKSASAHGHDRRSRPRRDCQLRLSGGEVRRQGARGPGARPLHQQPRCLSRPPIRVTSSP